MKPLLIHLDEQTLVALNRVAAPDKRKRSEFVRQAIRRAVRQAECRAMRDAYRKQPDSAQDADDWSTNSRRETVRIAAVEPQRRKSRVGVLSASRHIEVKRALGYALGWEELIDLGSSASG